MTVIIGSARSDERGLLSGGQAGDQTGKEVSIQNFYVHKKGWYILRPISITVADRLADAMTIACNNANIGYDQSNRLGVVKNGVGSTVKTEADCSALVRACCNYAGFDPGNFTTANEVDVLLASGKFLNVIPYSEGIPLYTGDVLVTKTKGHTAIVVSGQTRMARPVAPSPTLKKGSKGQQVKYLQQCLNFLNNACLEVDGSMGAKTVEALKKWQKQSGLVADGSYGPKSYAEMCKQI